MPTIRPEPQLSFPTRFKTGPTTPNSQVASAIHPHWQIQTAKARLSEVFRRARTLGPQRITRPGKEGVVLVAEELYERLVAKPS